MKIEQISKNSYRVRKQYKGTPMTLYFDHRPTEKEVTIKLSDIYNEGFIGQNTSLKGYMREYIEIKRNILSPSTIRAYSQMLRATPQWFLNIKLLDVTQADIQKVINEYHLTHSAKSARNLNGFIIPVIKMYRPNFHPQILLPKARQYQPNLPTKEEVLKVIDYFKDTEFSISIQLACLGLRRSEICALEISDLKGNVISITKGKVFDEHHKNVVKDMPKTLASVRKVYVPDKLADEIRQKGYIYKGNLNAILKALYKAQDELGIHRFRLHDLRHFYVSYAHSMGMVDADIMKAAGYTTDQTMKKIYRHSLDVGDEQRRINNNIFD